MGESIKEILKKSGDLANGSNSYSGWVKQSREKVFVNQVKCAYCRGSGVDPDFGDGSTCKACGGQGSVDVTPPVVSCLNCRGSGRERGNLTCLSCGGVGVVEVAEDAITCPKCNGTGENGVFYCTECKGQGIR